MSDIAIGMAAPEGVALTVLTHLKNGKIDDAIARFVEKLTFKDHGIGLEFKDTERLSEFFRKTRELYPDSFLETDTIFVSGDHVIMEWTLHTSVTEPFYGGLARKIQVSVHGASIVRTENGKITDWADYYDGLTSRRTALAAHFKEWVEL
jgi:ketosteroid isomerase-like protein